MKVLNAIADIHVGAMRLAKNERYVTSDTVAAHLASAAPGLLRVVADAHIYTRPWRGEDLAGKHLLIHRPLGIGDEFLAARLAAVAKSRFNAAKVTLAIFQPHHAFWPDPASLPFSIADALIPWSLWQSADFHVAGENWWESLGLLDQPDVWDIMASVCNITFFSHERIPFIPTTPKPVLDQTKATILPWSAGRPIIIWQLSATSRIRSYPPDETRRAMSLILSQTNACIIAVGHQSQIDTYAIKQTDRLATYSGGIPGLIAIVAVASTLPSSCVICPDSVLGHIAAGIPANPEPRTPNTEHPLVPPSPRLPVPASSPIPVISLWSSFDPRTRVAAYSNHHPIYNRIKCSPCWCHEITGDPARYHGCPATACNDYCAGLRSIAPSTIAAAVQKLIPAPPVSPAIPNSAPASALVLPPTIPDPSNPSAPSNPQPPCK
jgi:hypothetical protein